MKDDIKTATNYDPGAPLKRVLNIATEKFELRLDTSSLVSISSTSVETGTLKVSGIATLNSNVEVAGAINTIGNITSNANFVIKGNGGVLCNSIGEAEPPELTINGPVKVYDDVTFLGKTNIIPFWGCVNIDINGNVFAQKGITNIGVPKRSGDTA